MLKSRLIKFRFIRWSYEHCIVWSSYLMFFSIEQVRKAIGRGGRKNLHIGCGKNRFPGWINADMHPAAECIVILQHDLPFKDNELLRIYSEHVLEHVPYDVAKSFVSEAMRVLAPGGVMRVAMPSLSELVDAYQTDWRRASWVNWPEFSHISTGAQMINAAFRWWGHQHLYDREEVARLLAECGVRDFRFCNWGESAVPEFKGLETRADSQLIFEIVKS